MSEMVERVARALARRDVREAAAITPGTAGATPEQIELAVDEVWPTYSDPARDAIAAVREPTSAMMVAAAFGPTTYSEGGDNSFDYISEDDAATCWRAMIDAALAEEPKP